MRAIFLAVAASVCMVNVAQAQVLEIKPQRIGRQVITDIITAPPAKQAELLPKPIAPKGVKPVAAQPAGRFFEPEPAVQPVEGKLDTTPSSTAAVIKIKNWSSGKGFVDIEGRRWRMVRGACMERLPKELTGWRLITVEGEECFFTISGRLFTSQ